MSCLCHLPLPRKQRKGAEDGKGAGVGARGMALLCYRAVPVSHTDR